jgi:hypothetical protein
VYLQQLKARLSGACNEQCREKARGVSRTALETQNRR